MEAKEQKQGILPEKLSGTSMHYCSIADRMVFIRRENLSKDDTNGNCTIICNHHLCYAPSVCMIDENADLIDSPCEIYEKLQRAAKKK